MRYLGIDYGTKKVGVAISDPNNSFAFPLVVLENSKELISSICDLCKVNSVKAIIVGESKDNQQKNNKIMDEITPFVENLKSASKLPIYFHPEFFTSLEAERIQGKNHLLDASAAAIILKSYLDSRKV